MNGPDVIHLHGGAVGAGVNLGDTLMLQETIRRLRRSFGAEVRLSIRPEAGPYLDRAGLGLFQHLRKTTRRRPRGLIGYPMLRRYGPAFGVVTNDDVAVCLNFMGYRYFDVGRYETKIDLELFADLHRRGAPTLMLPQAYGPFSSAGLRRDAKALFDRCALVFARDAYSAGEVAGLGSHRPEVVPDFTIATPAVANPRADLAGGVCLIPNLWMTQRVEPPDAQAYVASLASVANRVRQAGRKCFVLSHSPRQDQVLAEQIAASCAGHVEVVNESDALKAKAIIGGARFVVGSRYHGLLAALSQGVPVLATSWAHKYRGLLDDYGCPEMLIQPSRADDLAAKLEWLLSADGWTRAAEKLPAANAAARAQIEQMWTRVLARVGDCLRRSPGGARE